MPERARQIMEAAMELADEGGFEAVRLRDVASRAGVALGTLYARFKSKEDILVAVLEQEAAKLEELLGHLPTDPTHTAVERVEHYFTVVSRAMLSRPDFARALLHAVSVGGPETAAKIVRYQGRLNRLIVSTLRGPDDERPLPEECEEEFAFLLQQIWYAALVGWMNGIRPEEEVMAQMSTAIRTLLAGFQALAE